MGCDIHLYTEMFDGCRWRCIGGLPDSEDRWGANYWVFAHLAGARKKVERRANVPTPYPARGLPFPVSPLTDGEWQEGKGDAHHASWLTAEEFAHVIGVASDGLPGLDDRWSEFASSLTMLSGLGLEVRVVFWFDN